MIEYIPGQSTAALYPADLFGLHTLIMNQEEKDVLRVNQNIIVEVLSEDPMAFNKVITQLNERGILNHTSKESMIIEPGDSVERRKEKVRKLPDRMRLSLRSECFTEFLEALGNHGFEDLRDELQAQYDEKTRLHEFDERDIK